MKKTTPLLVYLKKDPIRPPAAASFVESIVDGLRNVGNVGGDKENEIYIKCDMTEKGLVLNGLRQDSEIKEKVLLRRPPFCPIKSLSEQSRCNELSEEISTRGVNIGVAILLESSDKGVLLTRRAKSMRTFPQVWVPPGGHLEHGETLAEAAIRELMEETGICIKNYEDSTSILGLWESSFPPVMHLGLPKRHHIVVYLHHKISSTAEEVNKKIQLQKTEVDACTWICACVAEKIIATDQQFSRPSTLKRCHSYPNTCKKELEYIDGVTVSGSGKHDIGQLIATEPLFANVGETRDNERVSTGTKYALKLWLNRVSPTDSPS